MALNQENYMSQFSGLAPGVVVRRSVSAAEPAIPTTCWVRHADSTTGVAP